MNTVGELLKTARIEKKITLEQIAAYTKIRKKYLEAIEENDFGNLPSAAFTKGFLNTYSKIVGVNAQTILAIFRRDFDQDERGHIIPRSLINPVKPAMPGITPSMLTIGLSVIAGIFIIGFFARQIILFSSSPPLAVAEPTENAILISPVVVRGTTDPESSVAINNRSVTVSQTGEFTTDMVLDPGQHTLVVTSTGRSGKKTTIERMIYIQTTP